MATTVSSRLIGRRAVLALTVVVLHALVLWALQSGLLRRPVEVIVPVAMLSEAIQPPAPKVVPPPPAPVPAPVKPQPLAQKPQPAPPPPLAAIADPTPAPTAPTGAIDPPPAPPVAVPVAPVALAAPSAPSAPPAPPAPPAPKVELPSSDADYLQNPKPPYPPISKRLGEQGKVVVRVLINTQGTAERGEIKRSSGFERLDQTALSTVLRWRYVPGRRAGVPETMWFDVPINFVLE